MLIDCLVVKHTKGIMAKVSSNYLANIKGAKICFKKY